MQNFADRMCAAVREKNSRVCVGLDPHLGRLPPYLLENNENPAEAVEQFCCRIVDAVVPHSVAVKLQAAHFEVLRQEGLRVLWSVADYARSRQLLVIVDAKRNDIGSTAQAYATAYLRGPGGADALTVNPYLGTDGISPFVQAAAETGRGIFILVKTSNPSSAELQDLPVQSEGGPKPLYRYIGDLVARWGEELIGECGYSAVGAVVGAIYPGQLAELRGCLPHVPFLVPGYGAQGATAQDIGAALDNEGLGAIINSSRDIIFAYERQAEAPEQFAKAAGEAAAQMKEAINRVIA